ncbi:origin recognition complex subunit 3 [Anopheles darlingi]|uniref:Origin recognition complex subunit 3 n=1 Tax=Anopheles darlingi TaxID=43151 RepID=W5J683_ANODA|nr:origin recognition complex subunit 3 [Anopheles darlingi]XP_049544263.1 origin recognition complex subunit 3 [Anopheles darlingi]ETN59932.1 origin recognition complex subunit 3 [Anopheles darlingi]
MEATNSVSKGVFLFNAGAKPKRTKDGKTTILDESMTEALWYRGYRKHWDTLQRAIKKIQSTSYGKVLDDLLAFVEDCYFSTEYDGALPTAILLTGINQPDHLSQFRNLSEHIRNKSLSYVVILQSWDCSGIKQAIESMVGGFMEQQLAEDGSPEKPLRKNQLNLPVLEAWYLEKHDQLERKPNLTIILPEFENFKSAVLEDFILILNSHASKLPFVLIFGVATTINSIHSALPYHVTSMLKLSTFQSEPSITHLNKLLDHVFLTPFCPLHISAKALTLLLDIFLFYDFSVNGFVQGLKLAFIEHYFDQPIHGLCTIIRDDDELSEMIEELTADHLLQIRELPSFRPFVESLEQPQAVIDILTDDDHLKRSLPAMLLRVHNYWFTFHCALEILHTLVSDLPKAPLGKYLRELYCHAAASDVTVLPEFQECMKLLSFLSKEEMLLKIKAMLDIVLEYVNRNDQLNTEGCIVYEVAPLEQMAKGLVLLSDELAVATYDLLPNGSELEKTDRQQLLSPSMGRQELREKLLTGVRSAKQESGVTRTMGRLMKYLVKRIFQRYLKPPNASSVPLIELFLFSDSAALRRHLIGSPRAAIHTALTNPQHYLQCECCILDDPGSILPTLPDISIAYKLHLECGKLINLYDWLQAFRAVVEERDPDDLDEQVSPQIQARFTLAVCELQFLGFIKTSKRKTDHVTRLFW